jgi:hypothetical protein
MAAPDGSSKPRRGGYDTCTFTTEWTIALVLLVTALPLIVLPALIVRGNITGASDPRAGPLGLARPPVPDLQVPSDASRCGGFHRSV